MPLVAEWQPCLSRACTLSYLTEASLGKQKRIVEWFIFLWAPSCICLRAKPSTDSMHYEMFVFSLGGRGEQMRSPSRDAPDRWEGETGRQMRVAVQWNWGELCTLPDFVLINWLLSKVNCRLKEVVFIFLFSFFYLHHTRIRFKYKQCWDSCCYISLL